jgi:hypothetical protein
MTGVNALTAHLQPHSEAILPTLRSSELFDAARLTHPERSCAIAKAVEIALARICQIEEQSSETLRIGQGGTVSSMLCSSQALSLPAFWAGARM